MTENNILTHTSVEENFNTAFLDRHGDNSSAGYALVTGSLGDRQKQFLDGILNNLTAQENICSQFIQPSCSEVSISNYNSEIFNKTATQKDSSIHGESKIEKTDSNKKTASTCVNLIGNREKMFINGVMNNTDKLPKPKAATSPSYQEHGILDYESQLFKKQKVQENANKENKISGIEPAEDVNIFSKSYKLINACSGNRKQMFINGIKNDINPNGFNAVNEKQERPLPYSVYGILNHKSSLQKKDSFENLPHVVNDDNTFVNTYGNREKMFKNGVMNHTAKVLQSKDDNVENTQGTIFPLFYGNPPKNHFGNREKMFINGVMSKSQTLNRAPEPPRVPPYSEHGIFNYEVLDSPDSAPNASERHGAGGGGDGNSSNANGDTNGISEEAKNTENPAYSRITARVKKSRSFALLSDAAGEDKPAGHHDAHESERRVMVIYTGGTIGMVKNSDGVLAPIKGEFEERTRSFPQLHDAAYLRRRRDQGLARSLVLPEVKDLKARIVYEIHEKEVLLDSSNITPEEWTSIARDVKRNYDLYDGFVVLHGTDTLAYTAAALSFMFENIGKPLVITGSQIPIFEPRSDGADNFVSAIIVAGGLDIPEVTVMFGSKLFRGNRTQKVSSHNFNAFDSPNFVPLVEFGMDIEVNTKAIFRPNTIEKCRLHERMSKNVALIRIFPSISPAVLRAFLQPPIEGVVVESYGSGNLPSNREIFREIESAVRRGVIVVNITQCATGSVAAPVYETGRLVQACGVTSGYDMTAEAALAKLSYVLTKEEWNREKKIEMMTSNIRGELTSALDSISAEDNNSLIDALASSLKIASPKQLIEVTDQVLAALLLHAIDREEEVAMQRMQQLGAEVNSQNSEGKTPLHEAINKQNANIVKYLLLRGANVHLKTRNGESPLLTAIQRDNHTIIRLLLNCGAHLSGSDAQVVTELLSLAARRGHLQRLQSLRIAGADFSLRDEMKQTALHKAVLCNQPEVVRFLLDQHIEADVPDVVGNSPLDYAIQLGHKPIIDMLQ